MNKITNYKSPTLISQRDSYARRILKQAVGVVNENADEFNEFKDDPLNYISADIYNFYGIRQLSTSSSTSGVNGVKQTLFHNGLFVIKDDRNINYSESGSSWQGETFDSYFNFIEEANSIVFGLFSNGIVKYTSDLKNYTTSTVNTGSSVKGVTYDTKANQYVAVTSDGVYSSKDLGTWAKISDKVYEDIIFVNNKYFACGANVVAESTNAVEWSETPFATTSFLAIKHVGNSIVAYGAAYFVYAWLDLEKNVWNISSDYGTLKSYTSGNVINDVIYLDETNAYLLIGSTSLSYKTADLINLYPLFPNRSETWLGESIIHGCKGDNGVLIFKAPKQCGIAMKTHNTLASIVQLGL